MMRSAAAAALLLASLVRAGPPVVADAAPKALEPFAYGQVELLPGPVKDAFDTNLRYLKSLEPDRFLWTFRKTAGLETPGRPYGGWEGPEVELRGHSMGHYLSACARAIAQTKDAELTKNAAYTVTELARCQAALGGGYLSAFPAELFDRVEAGRKVWAPYYTIHKVMLGLWEMHAYAGSEQALTVLRGMADYFKARCDRLNDEQMQAMLGNEFGGMHEVLLNLYASTGERRYFELAQRFQKRSFIGPLREGKDPLPGIHANTHIPQVAGQARAYELTGDNGYKALVEHFWNTLWGGHSYATGGSNSGEYWGPPGKLAGSLSATNQEFCTSYNWEKINRYLMTWTGEARYGDMIERVFYNGILVSQHPKTGMLIYYMPLKTGLKKDHGSPFDTFTCCYGTGIQEYASLAQNIYFRAGPDLHVNLFVPSRVSWEAGGQSVQLTQKTTYPESPTTTLTLALDKPAEFAITLRVPWWADAGFEVRINGSPLAVPAAAPGSWLPVRRTWAGGDRLDVRMPMSLRTVPISDDPELCAVMYGPLVLAGLVDRDLTLPGIPAPPITGDKTSPAAWLRPVEGQPLTFRTSGMPRDLTFIPIHKVVGENYGIYWRFGAGGEQAKAQYEAAVAAIQDREDRTIDRVQIGDAASEREHDLQGENTGAGPFGGHHWRHAYRPGFFAYRLKLERGAQHTLSVMYWGSDGGSRTFDILVDGTKIATERLAANRPGEFYYADYPIPEDLARGKPAAVVRFQPSDGGDTAGGIFDLRVLRRP